MARIGLEDVGKVYSDGTQAVAGVDLDIADGEFLVLVGPSGCGKSTLLRMIAGLEEVSEGKITIGDRVVNDIQPKDRDIAMVFQNYALYPHMSVFENMAFGLKLRHVDLDEIKRRVAEVAELLELKEYLERKPKALSGGQRQRVAMGRAIVREPTAFLMDEPLSNLDAKLRVLMRTELSRLHERLGTTTVYVTHDQVEAMTLGQRVAVLKPYTASRPETLQQVDTPNKLYEEPRNLFVAGFIGSPAMNIVSGRLEGAGESVAAVFGEARLELDRALLKENPAIASWLGKPVVIGIRPEAFEDTRVARERVEGRTLDIVGLVVEVLGPETFVHFEIPVPPVVTPDIEELLADSGAEVSSLGHTTMCTARVSSDADVAVGQPIELAVDTGKMHVFDPESGSRIF